MGLFDRLAKAVAEQLIEKAPNLPAGTIVQTESQVLNSSSQTVTANATPLPRNPIWGRVPFGSQTPILPGAIDPLRESDGRPDPRRYEYQVAQNINITETRLVPFKTLRAAAEQIDILRLCVEVVKNKLTKDFDIVLSQAATEKIISESGGNHLQAMSAAREKFEPEIARIREFWEVPDRQNGLLFNDWLKMFLEDLLVLDAVAVWGQKSLDGSLYGFQLLDGSTIKPMLDNRGMRPMDGVAYQQILFGFPRSEFLATSDDPNADGNFTSDELAYLVKNRRTFSVYGYSPVEQALPLADIYLRYEQWIRSEFTDGVMPELFMTSDIDVGENPELLIQYERVLNDDLSGQTEQRKRARLLPAGVKPEQMAGYTEKFNAQFIDTIITRITGFFGITPSEVGITPKSGLGGAGHEQGQAANAQEIGLLPLQIWIEKQLSQLSYTFLGMPRELEFKFMEDSDRNTVDNAKADDIRKRNGGMTVNEDRASRGEPLLDTPEADMPYIVAGTNLFFLTPDGVKNASTPPPSEEPTPSGETPPEAPASEAKPEAEINSDAKDVKKELKAFTKWINGSNTYRPYKFKYVEPIVGEALNKCAADGDIETARALISAYTE